MIRLSFIILIMALSSHSPASERWQQDGYIINSFIKIALEREYKETKFPKLIRWVKPIHIFVDSDHDDTEFLAELLSVHAKHLSSITGLPIKFVDTPKKANLFTIFTSYSNMENKVKQYIGDPDRIRAALNEAICLGNFRRNSRYEITRGTIIIPVDYAREKARLLDCIVEEITQLLGLPNDSDEVFPSIFNDRSVDAYLSPLDYILLKALYSPHLKQGMDVTKTRAALPKVLASLKANNDIKDAAEKVQKGSLKSYLGE
ncbi:DUF2927 domain-containing protein [Marinomonas sp. C2222]|uniref:DUF2927 domain-containing protein n=1 Tax=Marinomonas sargassi TaxID=2984494 RepID=A0ABT2YWF8_9GAMM|nr:DUF2927 domain-containing protein [Marinomonas sargassi]MCV2403904.1 DUF2927 domain-containing protein [Marinomonas sargassi]